MSSSARTRGVAGEPAALFAVIEDAVNRADIDALVDVYDDAAVVVAVTTGGIAIGRAEIRAASVALLALRPRLAIAPVTTLRSSEGLALAHGRWHLTVVDQGGRVELSGLGSMVSRQCGDGSWRVVLDDPLTAP